MHIQNRIEDGIRTENEIQFNVNGKSDRIEGVPAGKMITDSDELSFVYLFDQEDGYAHIHFPQTVWPLMVDVLEMELEPVLLMGDNKIPLPGFKEELTMLIYNIEGNHNYGEVFSSAVEQAFSSLLHSVE